MTNAEYVDYLRNLDEKRQAEREQNIAIERQKKVKMKARSQKERFERTSNIDHLVRQKLSVALL